MNVQDTVHNYFLEGKTLAKVKKLSLWVFTALAAFVLAACGADNGADDNGTADEGDNGNGDTPDELVLGFVVSSDAENIQDNADPIAEYLSEELGIDVTANVVGDYSGLVESMVSGQTHIGFLPPVAYVQATDAGDVEVIGKAVRHGAGTYVAQYVVDADSGIESVDDLIENDGYTWAFPGQTSTSGFIFPGLEFIEGGVEDLDTHFDLLEAAPHDAAIIAVLDGQADFATTFDDARTNLEDEFEDIYETTEVIGHTSEIPNDTISLYGGLPDDLKEDIRAAVLDMDEDALAMIHEIYEWDEIEEADDAEFDIVRDAYAEFQDLMD